MEIRLRSAEPNDSQIIAELIGRAFADGFVRILGDQAVPILADWFRLSQRHVWTTTVAEVEGQAVGFIILNLPTTPLGNDEWWLWQALRRRHHGVRAASKLFWLWLLDSHHRTTVREVYVEMIGVDSAWQGRGVGQTLLAHAERVATTQGVAWLTLSVLSDNQAALHFYDKVGFKIYRQQNRWGLQWLFSWRWGQRHYFDMRKKLSNS